jgi:hypothetical protein
VLTYDLLLRATLLGLQAVSRSSQCSDAEHPLTIHGHCYVMEDHPGQVVLAQHLPDTLTQQSLASVRKSKTDASAGILNEVIGQKYCNKAAVYDIPI